MKVYIMVQHSSYTVLLQFINQLKLIVFQMVFTSVDMWRMSA